MFTAYSLDGSNWPRLLSMQTYSLDGSTAHLRRRGASFFFGVRIRLGTILGRFSIIYFRGLGLRIRVRVWVRVRVRVSVWVRVSVMVRVRVSVVLWSG